MPRGVQAAGQVPAPTIDESLDVVPTEWTEKTKKTRGRAAKAKATTTGKPRGRRAQATTTTTTTTAAISFKGILADRSKLLKALQIIQDIDEAQVKIECLENELNKLFN